MQLRTRRSTTWTMNAMALARRMRRQVRHLMFDRFRSGVARRGHGWPTTRAEHVALSEKGTHSTSGWVCAHMALHRRGIRVLMALYNCGPRAHMALYDCSWGARLRLPPADGSVWFPVIGGLVVQTRSMEVLGPGGGRATLDQCPPANDDVAGANGQPLTTHFLPAGARRPSWTVGTCTEPRSRGNCGKSYQTGRA